MSIPQHFKIAGSARYLPAVCTTAAELDLRLELAPGWTEAHTGIQLRYEAVGAETAVTMARRVVAAAIADAGVQLSDLDLIVDASLSMQQPVPCNAALVQEALGADALGIAAIDVHASCLGFIAALQVVNGLFASGSARRAVVVCSETPLRGVNWAQPESACLMGDGAVAIVLEAVTPITRWAVKLETYSDGAHLCEVQGGGNLLPAFAYRGETDGRYRFNMDGKAIHKMVSRRLPGLLENVLSRAQCSLSDLDVIPHQASGPAIELLTRRLGISRARLHSSIQAHGNLAAAGIPFVLDEVRRGFRAGTRVLLLGTAAGYTQGAAIFSL